LKPFLHFFITLIYHTHSQHLDIGLDRVDSNPQKVYIIRPNEAFYSIINLTPRRRFTCLIDAEQFFSEFSLHGIEQGDPIFSIQECLMRSSRNNP